MGARATSEAPGTDDGHDAIVRRLLAARSAPSPGDGAPPAEDLAGASRQFSAATLAPLRAFAGASLDWAVRPAALVPWSEAWSEAGHSHLASPLTREMRLVALVAADAAFLPLLMGALFGRASARADRDPTASELCVFAQLAVRLRDALAPLVGHRLDHGPPEPPSRCMELLSPDDPSALAFDLQVEAAGREETGCLRVMLTRASARRLLPSEPCRSPDRGAMAHLGLPARIVLPGPNLTLAEVEELRVGQILALPAQARPAVTVAGRTLREGRLEHDGPHRTLRLSHKEIDHG